MKVLHVCLCSQFNDSLTYQENLFIKYHMLFGHDVEVLTSTKMLNDAGMEIEVTEGVSISKFGYRIHRLKNIGPQQLRFYKNLDESLRKVNPDFVFMHGTQFLGAINVTKYCRNNGIKIVADNHADYYNSGQSWFSLNVIHKVLWRYTTQIVVEESGLIFGVSPIRCQFIEEIYGIPKKCIELLPLGADDFQIKSISKNINFPFLKQKYNLEDEFVVVTGGKIDKNKNLISLLVAIQSIKSQQRVKLLVFGTIYGDVQEEIDRLGLNHLFTFVGWIGPQEMYELFLISNLNVFLGSHSVLWEQAVACGKPTIFKKIVGMEHVNVLENSVLIDNPDNVEVLSELVLRFITDTTFYTKMLKNAEEAAKYFSYSEISKRAIFS